MTSLSPQGKVDRLLRIFERTGGEGQWTRAFERLPDASRVQMLEHVPIALDELPVLAHFEDEARWTLITTDKVVICRGEQTRSLRWTEIADTTVDAGYASAMLGSHPRGKLALNRLTLVCVSGELVAIELEAGPPFIGLWNVLKTLGNLRAG
ncbi:hypothetical protein SAMN05443572_1011145 [Myxococcus fulvus]|uniref:YokE-like PH domain-containing protein n=1 Tax=Myxococcus fulvus TaxID=33 RepID=A0A511STQ5_MYXFU|nr:hypothetical protein [Myxococcus fulvus]GEN05311.1 hypothetical protein MFU01_03480 [Myxococcus fulvus]SET11524.1 hypothetical protein SAMN05443572_1011145 [Myxococcus fulvus]